MLSFEIISYKISKAYATIRPNMFSMSNISILNQKENGFHFQGTALPYMHRNASIVFIESSLGKFQIQVSSVIITKHQADKRRNNLVFLNDQKQLVRLFHKQKLVV